jgi:hypothetical protein
MLTLIPFTKRYPWVGSHILLPILGYQVTNFVFPFTVNALPLSYPAKSKLSQWLICDTILYRRDKIMAQSIIEHAKQKVQKDDEISLCIFGSAHHQGICHYLQEKESGFTFHEKPVKF